jgi:hypothetical protein
MKPLPRLNQHNTGTAVLDKPTEVIGFPRVLSVFLHTVSFNKATVRTYKVNSIKDHENALK